MARASRYRAACAGLVLGLALSACALLPEERGKAPVGANLERLAAQERDRPIELGASSPALRTAAARP